jgi:hypothetical protein
VSPGPTSASRGASLTPREIVPALASAIASITIVGVELSLTMPLLALRLDGQGFSAQAIGLNSTAGGLAVLAGALFVPALARRLDANDNCPHCGEDVHHHRAEGAIGQGTDK